MFKVGDEVEFTDACDPHWFFGPTKEYKTGIIIGGSSNIHYLYTVRTGDGLKGFVHDKHIRSVIIPYSQFQTGDTEEDI